MELFRLTRKKHTKKLSGKGAARKGARWNSEGREIIYTATNRSLAMAEVAVHFAFAAVPQDYFLITIFVPDRVAMDEVNTEKLPENWNRFPYVDDTQKIGDDFIFQNNYCLLKVPSAVTKGDHNVLINPFHKDFKTIKIIEREKFPFDQRLFK